MAGGVSSLCEREWDEANGNGNPGLTCLACSLNKGILNRLAKLIGNNDFGLFHEHLACIIATTVVPRQILSR